VTHPPAEPPAPDGDPWQAPGPSPTSGPPQQQNPYGAAPTGYYQPLDPGGMSTSAKVVLGVVIGLFGGFVLWFFAAFLVALSGISDDTTFLFYAAVGPLLVPAVLLVWKATRPWAVGLLMGTAVASIGMSSLCSAMIGSL
jgi:hypothetical protein